MSAAEKIRWGVLATGGIAKRFVLDLQQVPDAEVVAVGSRALETAKAFAQELGVPRAYGSWAELANDPEIDVIYVATPHSHHHAASLVCLHAGKPLLVEKPFTLDLPSAQDIVTVARERGLFVMEAMWTRTNPSTLKMLELIADGAIGEVTAVQAGFGIHQSFDPSHRLRNPALGGGALLDVGVYTIHFAQLLLGAPNQVHASAAMNPEGTDARTGVILGFPNGQLASLYCGIGGEIRSATVIGSAGRIEFHDGFHETDRFVLRRFGAEPELITTARGSLHFQAAEVGRCLRAGLTESPLVPLDTTLLVMQIMDTVRAQIGVSYQA